MVKQNTDGLGADVVITACSVPDLQATALELAATCGRINFFGGLLRERIRDIEYKSYPL